MKPSPLSISISISIFWCLLIAATTAVPEEYPSNTTSTELRPRFLEHLPACNIIATCKYTTPCSYSLPSGCMLQYAFDATSSPFGFSIKSTGQSYLYIDYGPDPLHYFVGPCCNYLSPRHHMRNDTSTDAASACYADLALSWTYKGQCSVKCSTYAGVLNRGSATTVVSIYGHGPM